MNQILPLMAVLAVVGINAGIAYLISPYSVELAGMPAIALCIGLAFAIQWVVFVPAFLSQS